MSSVPATARICSRAEYKVRLDYQVEFFVSLRSKPGHLFQKDDITLHFLLNCPGGIHFQGGSLSYVLADSTSSISASVRP